MRYRQIYPSLNISNSHKLFCAEKYHEDALLTALLSLFDAPLSIFVDVCCGESLFLCVIGADRYYIFEICRVVVGFMWIRSSGKNYQ